jgi:ABC-2 type transport system permease protein
MKRFVAFVKKESFHILRDARTLILLFIIPVVLVLLFGFAISTEIRDAEIAILDKSKDVGSIALTNKILASGYFRLNRDLYSTRDLQQAFREGEIKLAVVFPEQFYYNLIKHRNAGVQVITDATDPNTANILRNYINAIIRDYQREHFTFTAATHTIQTETRMLYNPTLESAFYFVPGVITIIITLVSAMMTSVTIAREKEMGTMEILLVSPLKPYIIILGKSIPYMALAMINALTILYLGYAVFHMPLSGNITLLIGECFLFVLTALALGIFISAHVKTQRVALLISLVGLFLPTMLLSGFIFPIESMPSILQWISNIVPAKWFIIIIKNIMLKGVGLETVGMETGILAGMTLFFLGWSIKRFNIRLE